MFPYTAGIDLFPCCVDIHGKNRFIKQANKNGFGIFLFHPMIIYVLYYILGGKNIHPLLLWAGISCVAYFASRGLTVLFRKMHLGVLIGE